MRVGARGRETDLPVVDRGRPAGVTLLVEAAVGIDDDGDGAVREDLEELTDGAVRVLQNVQAGAGRAAPGAAVEGSDEVGR